MTKIAISLLSADFARLGEDVNAALAAGADVIHFDVMDHHFVPNLSFGTIPCQALRDYGITAEIDVHLMVEHPEDYILPFAKAGASRLTFHPETVGNPDATLTKIRDAGMEAGLVFNPDQAITLSDEQLCSLDLILLMSVFPGFAGQTFIPSTFEKIRRLRTRLNQHQTIPYLGVDGGIKVDNIMAVTQAGADYCVVGSGLFSAKNYRERLKELRSQIEATK